MKSVLDDLPKDPASHAKFVAALETFLSEGSFHVKVGPPEQLDAAIGRMLAGISAWADGDFDGDGTGRLVHRWAKRRLPAMRDACGDFQRFVLDRRSAHPRWSLLQFVGDWFVTRAPDVAQELVLIFETVLWKNFEDQERQLELRDVVRKIRAVEKASAALNRALEKRTTPDGQTFWPDFIKGFGTDIGDTLGDKAAEAAAAHLGRVGLSLPVPHIALLSLRPEWERVFSTTTSLAARTLAAMQDNFMSATIDSKHAPEQRGVHFRIDALRRAKFSQSEIAEFERLNVKAVAAHVRRGRRSKAKI